MIQQSIQASPATLAKVEKQLSLRSPKATEKSLVCASGTGLKRANPCHDGDLHESVSYASNTTSSQQSPFRTPPSLSYYHDKVIMSSESELPVFILSQIYGKLLHFKILINQGPKEHSEEKGKVTALEKSLH